METILASLTFAVAVMFLVGLVKPGWVGRKSRGQSVAVYGIALVVCFVLIGSFVELPDPEPSSVRAEEVAAAPADPEEIVLAAIQEELGRSNRDVQRVSGFSVDDGMVRVRWALNDNLTGGMRRTGARIDATGILEAVGRGSVPYTTVEIQGTFSMADAFGNSSESVVVQAAYARSALDRVNWDGFSYDNVWSIAEGATIHPEFR